MSYNLEDRFEPNKGNVLVVTDDDLPDTYEGSTHLPSNLEGLTDAKYETIIVFEPKASTVEELGKHLEKDGVMFLLGDAAVDGTMSLDVGRIHYEGHRYYGGGDDHDAIAEANKRVDLLPGGCALFVGAGGPMGQMHVQRSVEIENGPKKVVVTDLDRSRLDHIVKRFGHIAEAKGIEFITCSPDEFESNEAMNRAVSDHAPNGYDDICILAPVAPLVTVYLALAADNCLMNVFAGVPAGHHGGHPPRGPVPRHQDHRVQRIAHQRLAKGARHGRGGRTQHESQRRGDWRLECRAGWLGSRAERALPR